MGIAAQRYKLNRDLVRCRLDLPGTGKRAERPLIELGDFLLQTTLAIPLNAFDRPNLGDALSRHMARMLARILRQVLGG